MLVIPVPKIGTALTEKGENITVINDRNWSATDTVTIPTVEYIDKTQALERICYDCNDLSCAKKWPCADYAAIRDISPADVKPVVRGEWMDCADKLDSRSNRHYYQCPKCGYYADYFICGLEDWWCAYEPDFCPHCGAYMRKKEDNE
jgi:hypothetical protein